MLSWLRLDADAVLCDSDRAGPGTCAARWSWRASVCPADGGGCAGQVAGDRPRAVGAHLHQAAGGAARDGAADGATAGVTRRAGGGAPAHHTDEAPARPGRRTHEGKPNPAETAAQAPLYLWQAMCS